MPRLVVRIVARDGRPILEKGYGFANREQNVPNSPETKFQLASVTKQFTAAAILHLAQQGKLDLQDPLTKHLPANPADPGERITIHHLLSHTSGIPNYLADPEIWAIIATEIPIPELVATFSHKPLDFEPGTAFAYSNSGYVLLGLIIEATSGQSYEEYLRDAVFQPLGMRDSGYGWVMGEIAGRRVIHHAGGMPGFTSHIGRYPDDGLTVIVLGNNDSAGADPLGFSLAGVAFGQPYDLPVRKTPIEIDPRILDDYPSAYMITEGMYRVIRRDTDGLTSQRTGGPVTRIFPEAGDKFYYASNHAITITFVRDSTGRVAASLMRQGGVETRHEALTGTLADSLLAERMVVQLDPAILERYAGEYELAPGFMLTFRSEGSRLFSRATGQEEVEVYPASETVFFLKVVEAEIAFELDDAGTPTGLVLTQGGREMPARRVQ